MQYRLLLGLLLLLTTLLFAACGEGTATELSSDHRAVADANAKPCSTPPRPASRSKKADLILTEADAGKTIQTPTFQADLGNPDKKGVMLTLEGDDAALPIRP